ncbi:MAG: amidohydrolase [Proteobacteria bacterium]|nr:amidohydrolase [Pseudomonadota bacterium]
MGLIKKIQDMKYEMTRWRQKLHAEPELAFEERGTSRFITRQLQSCGIEVHALAKTGVIGVLHGKDGATVGGKAIMLRADMDALPIKEESGAVHASHTAGVHHASGHDGHVAMLLGAAKYLAQSKNFNGTVYFAFQPAEEKSGAQEMIKDGIFQKFPCDEIYGLHSYPELPLGAMVTGPGSLLASAEEFHIVLKGAASHPSQPDTETGVMSAMTEVMAAIRALAETEIQLGAAALLAISSVHTEGQIGNALPGRVDVCGTIRTQDSSLHEKLRQGLENLVPEIAAKHNVDQTTEFSNACPVLVNSQAETNLASDIAKDIVGDNKVGSVVPRALDADDFACYLQGKPGNLMLMGTGRADGKPSPALYSSKYDFNDAALPIGASYWVKLVEKSLPLATAPSPKAPNTAPPQSPEL